MARVVIEASVACAWCEEFCLVDQYWKRINTFIAPAHKFLGRKVHAHAFKQYIFQSNFNTVHFIKIRLHADVKKKTK